jgi:hypothetical protein
MCLSILRPTDGQARPYDIWYTMALLSRDFLVRCFQLYPPLKGLAPVPFSSLACSVNVYQNHFISPYFKY